MMISIDTEVGAYYVRLLEGPVARTVHVSDDLAVDLDADGRVHGLELLCAPSLLSEAERQGLAEFPAAADAFAELERLLRPPLSAAS
jgi:uncharacterized protein YuzE